MATGRPEETTEPPENESFDKVLNEVRSWPAEWRFRLVESVLATIAPTPSMPDRTKTLSRALGLARTDQPPTDEEVERWQDERRTNRYG